MKVLYYECFSGISGDMNLAALIDLGVDQEFLINELSKLNLNEEFNLEIKKDTKNGISGTKFDVILTRPEHSSHKHLSDIKNIINNSGPVLDESEYHHNAHRHLSDIEDIVNHSIPALDESEHHNNAHRHLSDIEHIINNSDLSENVKKLSLEIFMKIAVAEAKVHDKPIEEVHFHEVGAIDSIVDIVGCAIAIDYLAPDKIICSPIQVGGGFIKCAHGLIPVPVPATVEILKNMPLRYGAVLFETTTPTGAAILAAITDEFVEKPDFLIEKIGYGLGTRVMEIPNVLRVCLGSLYDFKTDFESAIKLETNTNTKTISESAIKLEINTNTKASSETDNKADSKSDLIIDNQFVIETNIDDMNPEFYNYVEEKLFSAGALDVFKTPVMMKKGRSAMKLSILVKPSDEEAVLDIVFRETTSIGVRKFAVEKKMLRREYKKIQTKYGEITIKYAFLKGEMIKYKAEYDDCKKIALAKGIPIMNIYKEIDSILTQTP